MADIAVQQGAIDMAQGVVHTVPPDLFQQILNKHLQQRGTHIYSSPAGYIGYRQAVLASLRAERTDLDLDQVMATNGITGGLVAALRTQCQPQDRVALLEPFFPGHDWVIQALPAVTEYIPYNTGFNIDWDAVSQKLSDVKAMILANPANPTGTVLSKNDLLRLHCMCQEKNVLLIVDEVYREFVWEGKYVSLLSLVKDFNNLVILRSFSKSLALAGWRIGYAVTTQQHRAQMIHIHDTFYVGAPMPPQVALAELLTDHQQVIDAFIAEMVEAYRKNRQEISNIFISDGMEPLLKEGAYYMMVKHNRASDKAVIEELLKKGIAVAPGTSFYRPGTKDTGYFRAHFALSEHDLAQAKKRLVIQ